MWYLFVFFLVFLSDLVEIKFKCFEMKFLIKVIFKGGFKVGDFIDIGKVGSIKECYEICC